MTTEHETRTRPVNQGPMRRHEPICDTCKIPLTPPTDLDAAKATAARHKSMGAYVGAVRG